MRLGLVSDLHCNAEGLRRALDLMGDVDELLCLGDAIYEYRFSNEVVALLRERRALVIQGNHEECFLGPQGKRARSHAWIDSAHLEWLAAQPHERTLALGPRRLLMVHSTPWSPRGNYVFPGSPLLLRFAEADADIVVYGHTHMQLVQRVGKVLVINPGSAGEARDHRNGRKLSCAVLDTASEEVRMIDYE